MRNLILILLLACTACSTQAQPPQGQDAGRDQGQALASRSTAPGDGAATLARIRALAGDAGCSASSQCRTLALGARACGGPEAYLPYSTAATDEKALRALGEQYKAEREAANKAGGMMSICRHEPDPGAVCQAGKCVLGSSSATPSMR